MPTITTTATPTELYYEDEGTGQPIVLIHGWPLSHRMWESQITALTEAGYRCISYDRRGFGDSGRPSSGYDYDTFASDLNDLLTSLDLRDVVLAGFSMGGGEVARYIGRYGTACVAKAMLISAVPPFLLKTSDNPDGMPQQVFDDMVAGVKKDRIGFLEQFFPPFFNWKPGSKAMSADVIDFSKWIAWKASALGTAQCIVAFGTTDFRRDLAKFTIPTVVIHGDEDQIVPLPVSGRRSAELIKASTLEVIEGAPHGLSATHAEQLNQVMLKFLGGRKTSATACERPDLRRDRDDRAGDATGVPARSRGGSRHRGDAPTDRPPTRTTPREPAVRPHTQPDDDPQATHSEAFNRAKAPLRGVAWSAQPA
jgi:peroxiredoxin